MISNDAKCHREIRRRIAMGKEAFLKRKELLRGGLERSLKKRIIKTLIWSVTLYCAETWTMRQVDIARLEAFEMWKWRRMERISWTEHIERRSVNIGRRGKISYIHNQSKTKKLDGTPAERRLSSERNNGGKNGGEERKRKTKAKTIGLDDVGGIR